MKTVTRLSASNIKKSRLRSTLIIISILISTLMLTVIALTGTGLVKWNRVNSGSLYGTYYGTYNGVSEASLKQMELHGEFAQIGKMAVVGTVKAADDMSLLCADEQVLEMTNLARQLGEGTFPRKAGEIAAKPEFFKNLGMKNPQVGDTVTLDYRMDLSTPFEPDTFTISGLLKDEQRDSQQKSFSAYVSQEYYEAKYPAGSRGYIAYFRLDKSVNINTDNAEDVMKELAKKCGVDERRVNDNYMYLMFSLDPGQETQVVCVALCLIVILFSVAVIYNIFQVGVVQKIQEYGKIRAIGTTRRQMKQLIFREGMMLAAVGIPLGLLGGYVTATLILNVLTQMSDVAADNPVIQKVSLFQLPVLLLCAAAALLTVWLALKKPMKVVAGISPVEAMRYQGSAPGKRTIRKGRKSMTVNGLTAANLSANRKRTVSTIIAMGLSCVLFVVLANMGSNMDAEYDARKMVPHGQFQITLDHALSDTAYPENNLDNILKHNPLSAELLEKVKAIPEVTGVRSEQILFTDDLGKKEGQLEKRTSVRILARDDFENELKSGGTKGDFDYDSVTKANGIIHGASYFLADDGYEIGQERKYLLFDGKTEKEWMAPVMGAFGSVGAGLAITEDTYQALGFEGNSISTIWVDCDERDTVQVQKELAACLEGVGHVEMTTYADTLKSSASSISAMRSGSYLFCILIAVISFLNMANTIITSIVTRKQEFGVLQAIGMTNQQLNRSLQLEGILFTAGTVLVALAAGIPLGYAAFWYGKTHAWIGMYEYHFPIWEVGGMIVVLAGFQAILSWVLSRNVKKESLVDRIRYQE